MPISGLTVSVCFIAKQGKLLCFFESVDEHTISIIIIRDDNKERTFVMIFIITRIIIIEIAC